MRALPGVCGLILLTACNGGETEPFPGGFEIVVAGLTSEGCEPSTFGDGAFPSGVDSVVMQISGPDGYTFEPRRFEPADVGDGGAILVEGVPPGDDLTLTLYGCAAGAPEPTWSGQASDVAVEASQKTARRIYFTRKGVPSCTGRAGSIPGGFSPELAQPRAFATLVDTHEENTLVIGGFTVYVSENANTRVLSAGDPGVSTISEYRPSRGLFTEWSDVFDSRLLVPRAMHHVVPLDGGRRHLVIGGITRATISAPPLPPLVPTPQGAKPVVPSPAVEVIDAEARTVSASALQLGPLPYSALAHSPDGTTIVLSGGRLDSGAPSNKLQFVAGSASDLTSGAATVVTKDSAQPQPRMGHTATWFGDGQVLLLGGNVDDDLASLAEVLSGPQLDAAPVVFGDTPAGLSPMALHETVHVRSSGDGCQHTFLTAGGVTLTGGASPAWISPGQVTSPERLLLVEVDTCQNPIAGTITAHGAALGNATLARRALHELTPLGDDLFMLSGGYHQLTAKQDPACAGDTQSGCYLADISILQVGDDQTVTLASSLRYLEVEGDAEVGAPRLGHTVGLLPNRVALTVGGLRAITAGQDNLVDDPELLNPERPSESAACNQE